MGPGQVPGLGDPLGRGDGDCDVGVVPREGGVSAGGRQVGEMRGAEMAEKADGVGHGAHGQAARKPGHRVTRVPEMQPEMQPAVTQPSVQRATAWVGHCRGFGGGQVGAGFGSIHH